MNITEAADYFKTTERTVSDWRKKGAPVANVAELTTWLESNLRHTTLDTQAVIDHRRKIEALGKDFVRAYHDLCEALEAERQDEWERVIFGYMMEYLPDPMTSIAIMINPDLATVPKEKAAAEKLKAEPWPVSGKNPQPKN